MTQSREGRAEIVVCVVCMVGTLAQSRAGEGSVGQGQMPSTEQGSRRWDQARSAKPDGMLDSP